MSGNDTEWHLSFHYYYYVMDSKSGSKSVPRPDKPEDWGKSGERVHTFPYQTGDPMTIKIDSLELIAAEELRVDFN